jgi:hypothetical protein
MNFEYILKSSQNPLEAKIFFNDMEVGEIKVGEDFKLFLISRDGSKWILDKKVYGEFRPFSVEVAKVEGGIRSGVVFTILEHIFKHNNRFYMMTNLPEGKKWSDSLTGPKYIGRLNNFPFTELKEIDQITMRKLRRFYRGVKVGEIACSDVHNIVMKINDELTDIGLILAACSYVIYSSDHMLKGLGHSDNK